MEGLLGVAICVGIVFFVLNRSDRYAVKNRDQSEPTENGKLLGWALIFVFICALIALGSNGE